MTDAIALELLASIARIRRAMPRDADAMKLCDFAEEQLRQRAARRRPEGPRFDKRTFMRNYMRAWRKKRAAERTALPSPASRSP